MGLKDPNRAQIQHTQNKPLSSPKYVLLSCELLEADFLTASVVRKRKAARSSFFSFLFIPFLKGREFTKLSLGLLESMSW